MLENLTAARTVLSAAPVSVAGVTKADIFSAAKPAVQSRWILNCPLDLLFVCGGALWLLLFCTIGFFVFSYSNANSFVSFLLIAGALIFADAHNAATIVRFIDEPGLAARHPYVSILLPVLMVIVVLGILLSSPMYLAWALKLYMILIAQHVTAQAYGITMIYMRKSHIKLGARQILVVKAAFTAMMLCGIARQLSVGSTMQMMGVYVPQLTIVPEIFNLVCVGIAVLASVVMLGTVNYQCKLLSRPMHPGVVFLTGSTLMLYTLGPVVAEFALLAPAFFHGTQYLAVTTANAMNLRTSDAQSVDRSASQRTTADESTAFQSTAAQTPAAQSTVVQAADAQLTGAQPLAAPLAVSPPLLSWDNIYYWTKLLTLGALLYLVMPMLLSKLGFAPVAAMAAVFCTVNFHHFVADAVIWRGRNLGTLTPVS